MNSNIYVDPYYDDEVVNGPMPTWGMHHSQKISYVRVYEKAENKNGYLWMCDYFAYWGWC